MNGPPLALYGSLRRWTQERFRATLQGYFFPASLVGMIGYWAAGLSGASVTNYYLLSLPVVLVAIFVGRVLNRRPGASTIRHLRGWVSPGNRRCSCAISLAAGKVVKVVDVGPILLECDKANNQIESPRSNVGR